MSEKPVSVAPRQTRASVLGSVIVVWLGLTAALMGYFNPISAMDLAEICGASQSKAPSSSASRR